MFLTKLTKVYTLISCAEGGQMPGQARHDAPGTLHHEEQMGWRASAGCVPRTIKNFM